MSGASGGVRTLAIEPARANLQQLYLNLLANGWEDTEILPLTPGSKTGIATLYGDATDASVVKGWAGLSLQKAAFVPVATCSMTLGR